MYVYACTYVCTYVRTYGCIYVFMYVCIQIYIYIYGLRPSPRGSKREVQTPTKRNPGKAPTPTPARRQHPRDAQGANEGTTTPQGRESRRRRSSKRQQERRERSSKAARHGGAGGDFRTRRSGAVLPRGPPVRECGRARRSWTGDPSKASQAHAEAKRVHIP